MSLSSSISFTATGGSTTLSGIVASATGSNVIQVDVDVPASTTDQNYAVAIDISELELIFLYTDGALTLETNSGSSPDDTFVFSANKPLVWVSGMPTVDGVSQNPFDADVTSFKLTNASGSAVALRGIIVQSL